MGKFKNVGDPAAALMEECAEVIQVIAKLKRFDGKWSDDPELEMKNRWMKLEEEMDDLLYQWLRLKEQRKAEKEQIKAELKKNMIERIKNANS